MKKSIWCLGLGLLLTAGCGESPAPASDTASEEVTLGEAQSSAISGGQIRRCGYFLCDANGARWKLKGVQFILPQTGINGRSFDPGIYSTAKANGSLGFWLDQASGYLLANTVRIFIDWPGQYAPTTKETVNDFLNQAAARGMRVGITFNFASSWNSTQKAWVSELARYIRDNGGLSRVAYFNASNELNNYCGSGNDCFRDQNWVNGAVAYVADFHNTINAVDATVLTTVGMSSENIPNAIGETMGNYFKRDAQGRNIAGIVDFLSPHNYGGAGYAIFNEVRYTRAYPGPIVLEEFGFPTDNVNQDRKFTEGPTRCANDPGFPKDSIDDTQCENTAPYFVEINCRAMRDLERDGNGYAGAAAWMLVDVEENRTSCSVPFDFYTGLFTSGRTYCGGTYTPAGGRPKATAFRVRTHYYYW
jgi:hypothetical protein